MQRDDLSSLYDLLKSNGDQIIHTRSKLSLSATLLQKINAKLSSLMPYGLLCSFDNMINISEALDLQLLYHIVEHTVALKVFSECNQLAAEHDSVDLHFFRNLKLLEVQRFSIHLLKGLKTLRSQLRFITCMRSVNTLRDLFELCGADNSQGYVWSELKEAIFSHNYLKTLDGSLEFVPGLEYLDLSYNSITNIDNLNYLMNLRHLNLANNKIEVLPKFSNCHLLQTLILKHNNIEELTNLAHLSNLENLDISCNCLLNFDTLQSISYLKNLKRLQLYGNLLCYQKNYRSAVCPYLYSNISKEFTLDGNALKASELKLVGSIPRQNVIMESSGSYQSISGATVILADGKDMHPYASFQSVSTTNTVIHVVKRYEQTSDMEVSQTSVETKNVPGNAQLIRVSDCGMQDSGIFTGNLKPASPLTDSIGSATSHNEDVKITSLKRYSESDISILSNPSQSSIEVLSDNTPKCVQSTVILSSHLSDMCPDEELKKIGEELHRSL